MLISKLKMGFKSVKSIIMMPAQFITALCTKHIYLVPGCRSFCSAKIKFHAFVYNAAWKSCLQPGVHLIYYLFHNRHKQFVFVLLVNSALTEKYLLLSSYPPPLLHSYGDTRARATCEENSNSILQYFLLKDFSLYS